MKKILLVISVFASFNVYSNSITNYLVKQKHPFGHLLGVVDIVNAELQLRRSGINVMKMSNYSENSVLERRVVINHSAPCGPNCLIVKVVDDVSSLSEIIELLKRPCGTIVFNERDSIESQIKGSTQSFLVAKLLTSCDNEVVKLSGNQLKVSVN
jgi:hypothetical protein